MTINIFSVIMAIGLFTIISIICDLFLSRIQSHHLWIIAFALILCIIRCLIPFEINGSYTINIWNIYPAFFLLLEKELFYGIHVKDLLCAIWLFISLLLLLKQTRKIRNQIKFNETIKRFPMDSRINQIATTTAHALHCSAHVDVYVTSLFSSPIMTGFFHPIVLLPESTTNLEDFEIEYILRHEIGHYKGGDIWYKLGIQILVCFLWWNPAVYLLRRCVNQLLELRCDHRACQTLGLSEKSDYTNVLLKIAKLAVITPNDMLSAGFVGNFESIYIKQRIQILMTKSVPKNPLFINAIIVCICMLLYLGSYSIIIQPAYTPTEIKDDPTMVIITSENAWLIPIENNQYELWVDGSYYGTMSYEAVNSPPYNQLPIYEKED